MHDAERRRCQSFTYESGCNTKIVPPSSCPSPPHQCPTENWSIDFLIARCDDELKKKGIKHSSENLTFLQCTTPLHSDLHRSGSLAFYYYRYQSVKQSNRRAFSCTFNGWDQACNDTEVYHSVFFIFNTHACVPYLHRVWTMTG